MPLSEPQKQALFEKYSAAVNAGDTDTIHTLLAPNSTTWHNFDGLTSPLAAAFKGHGWMHQNIPGLRWETRASHITSTGFIWEAVIKGTARGGELNAHTCMIIKLDDSGLITSLDEYIDPASTAPIRG